MKVRFTSVMLMVILFTLNTQAGDESAPGLVRLTGKDMVVEFDKRSGAVFSIKEKNGKFGTNFIGNSGNYPGDDLFDSKWTGNIVTTTWNLNLPEKPLVLIPSFSFKPSGSWQSEATGPSGDIREISFDGETFSVNYTGRSENPGGIKSFNLKMAYRFAGDGSLRWDIEIENTTGRVLEIGELGIPFTANDHYYGVREDNPYTNLVDDHEVLYEDERLKLKEQPIVHEQRVAAHHFAGGHSSYSLIQRLLGDPPFLLVHPMQDTAFECIYRMDVSPGQGRRRGQPPLLALHSWAAQRRHNWDTPWVNGHTSLILEPGEKKSYQMRFVFIDGYEAVREENAKSGDLGIRVLPAMVVPEGMPAYVEITSRHDPEIELISDNIIIEDQKRLGNKTLLTLSFKGRGQKSLKLAYGAGKWTNLHFYCTEPTEELIKARAEFIAGRQFYENPEDPYGRHHMFLPFNRKMGRIYKDAVNVWEVGGSDEYGFSEPVYLSEKNVYFPNKKEVDTLEAYVSDCLFGDIQDPETFAIRASLYWKERYPSSPWGHWTEERSKETYRTYNYPHVVNTYHALYKIGKLYGLTEHRTPKEYLTLAYKTAVKWFNTGPWRHVGVMCGSNVLNVLDDLEKEGMAKEHAELLEEIRACNQVFVDTPYPYSSELFTDQTAHEHVYFFTRYFDNKEKYRKTLQVIQALRGGNQPAWFQYGNDKRGEGACWYTESLNGMPLLDGFEENGDMDMFIKGYAGVMSVTANLLIDGMGFGRFVYSPGVFDHEPPKTLDNGIGMYGFFKAAKAYVLNDKSFGVIGCGAQVEQNAGNWTVTPVDGLRKRLMLVEENIDIEAIKGEIQSLVYNPGMDSLELHMDDSTGLVNSSSVRIRGLTPGKYKLSYGGSSRELEISGSFTLEVPMSAASRIGLSLRN